MAKISDSSDYFGKLAAASYPRVEDVPGNRLFKRRWILRTSTKLPAGQALENELKRFELTARREVANAVGSSLESAGQTLPSVSAVRMSDFHLVLEINCPNPAAGMGDTAAIATCGILRAADERWQLEDLQGIPKRCWFTLGCSS